MAKWIVRHREFEYSKGSETILTSKELGVSIYILNDEGVFYIRTTQWTLSSAAVLHHGRLLKPLKIEAENIKLYHDTHIEI